MVEVARVRSGGQFDPGLTQVFLAAPEEITSGSGSLQTSTFSRRTSREKLCIAPKDIRRVAEAYADFIDIKSRFS